MVLKYTFQITERNCTRPYIIKTTTSDKVAWRRFGLSYYCHRHEELPAGHLIYAVQKEHYHKCLWTLRWGDEFSTLPNFQSAWKTLRDWLSRGGRFIQYYDIINGNMSLPWWRNYETKTLFFIFLTFKANILGCIVYWLYVLNLFWIISSYFKSMLIPK